MQWAFMRHGEAWWNSKRITSCSHENNVLTANGISQVMAAPLDNLLDVDLVVASPYVRAWMTAQIMRSRISEARYAAKRQEIGVDFAVDDDLIEYHYQGDHEWCSPGYVASRKDLRERVVRALRRRPASKKLLFVSHGFVMEEIKAIAEDRGVMDYMHGDIGHPRQAEIWWFPAEAFTR
jgi:broad specificity phosphatase PhoE